MVLYIENYEKASKYQAATKHIFVTIYSNISACGMKYDIFWMWFQVQKVHILKYGIRLVQNKLSIMAHLDF